VDLRNFFRSSLVQYHNALSLVRVSSAHLPGCGFRPITYVHLQRMCTYMNNMLAELCGTIILKNCCRIYIKIAVEFNYDLFLPLPFLLPNNCQRKSVHVSIIAPLFLTSRGPTTASSCQLALQGFLVCITFPLAPPSSLALVTLVRFRCPPLIPYS
jgi:hypothetical protein